MMADPTAMANSWKAGMGNPATQAKYKAGVAAVQTSPMAKAAAPDAQARYAQNTALAVSSGHMAAKLNAVPLSFWQSQTSTVGANNLSMGATKGFPKYQNFAGKWAPIFTQISQQIQQMPKGGQANAMARVAAAYQALKQAAGKPIT